jgi:ATP-binding cassette subfamily B protein
MSDAPPTPATPPARAVALRSFFPLLLQLARPELGTLAWASLALLVSTGLGLVYPQAIRVIMNAVSGHGGADAEGSRRLINQAALGLLAVFAVQGLFSSLRSYLFTVAGERVVARLRRRLYDALLRQEIAFFDEQRTGELTQRLAADTTVLQNATTTNISMALRYGMTVIGGIAILLYTSWRLTVVMLSVVPVVVLGAVFYGRSLQRLSRSVQDALARSTEVATETLAGIRTVRAFARETQEAARYGDAVDGSFALARTRARASAVFQGVVSFAAYGAIAAVLWYGGVLVLRGQMQVGDLTAFILYTLTVAFAFGAVSDLWGDFMRAAGASERLFELLEREPRLVAGTARPAAVQGALALRGVHFTYPARPDMPVLRGLDLSLKPGEVVAVVGYSGAGKSTIAALLSRFYDPQQGEVHLDGHDLRSLDAEWLREQVGVVSQEPILFATSIADNIRYGRTTATQAEVEAAAQAANAHAFVSAFPDGYNTLVGERGVRLSGGQKQRVAIARAILKDPRILVLDEATSALDAESEALVQQALDRLMQGRTTLIIAHRLSTVLSADRVVVLDSGRAVESGTHAELLARGGVYHRLVERQFAAATPSEKRPPTDAASV